MVDFSIMTYNANGLVNEKKRQKIFHHFHKTKINFIALQETHSIPKNEKIWSAEWGRKIIFSHGESNARGVALLISQDVNATVTNIERDDEGRYLIVSLTVDKLELLFVILYAPNLDTPEFFANVFAKSEEQIGRRIILGDLNTILDDQLDIRGGKGYSHKLCTEFIKNYLKENNLIDIWRLQHPDSFRSTFVRNKSTIASALMERIDYILIDSSLVQYVSDTDIKPAFSTDHAHPVATFKGSLDPPGPGYWKFNNTLLEDEKFVQSAVKAITDTLSDVSLDIYDRWDLMKFTVKQTAIIRSSEIKRSNNNKLHVLNKKLNQITIEQDKLMIDNSEQNEHTIISFEDHNEQISQINKEIEEITGKKIDGVMVRSKAIWYECAERPTKYFLSLEKNNYNKKTIQKIRDKEGNIVEGTRNILAVLNDYYSHLFSKDDSLEIDPDYLALTEIPQVKDSDKYWMEADISKEEIHLALKDMNKNKCPGTDGLTIEFYLKFWPMIASTLHGLFNMYIKRKILNKSARESITSLMPKPKVDALSIKAWRPLLMLNNDYKLYAKVIVKRMEHTAKYLIPLEQKGFMKGRKISDNLLNLISVAHFCDTNQLDSILLSFDFHQAFDSCSHEAIETVLHSYGYGERFISMVMLCYTDVKTAIMNNNTWTTWISLKSGVKQGCPLSGMIFNHLISILAFKIDQNNNIDGIKINGKKIVTDMFADDIWNVIPFEQTRPTRRIVIRIH